MNAAALKDRLFGVGHRVFTALGLVAGVLVAAGQYLDIIPPAYRTSKWYALAAGLVAAGAWWKAKMASAPAPGYIRVGITLVLAMVLGFSLLMARMVRADDPAPTSSYGGCFKAGGADLCAGPSISITLVAIDMNKGTFDGGIVPGVGYGLTLNPDKWYAIGFAGYLALQTGPVQSAMLSGVFSFANYLRFGVGWQAIGGNHAVPLLIGIGSDLR